MTETDSAASVNTPDAFRLGSVGRPLPGVQGQIADDHHSLIKGPNMFKGYYHDANAPRETLWTVGCTPATSGDWTKTGFCSSPVARRTSSPPAARTSCLRTSSTRCSATAGSRQAVVIGDGRPYLVALSTLDPEEAPAFAREHNLKLDEVHRFESMRAETETAIGEANSHYAPVEQIKRFEILPEAFSQPTGELTPTLKVKRRIVQQNTRKRSTRSIRLPVSDAQRNAVRSRAGTARPRRPQHLLTSSGPHARHLEHRFIRRRARAC